MLKPISIILCLLIVVSVVLCGCQNETEQSSETEPTTQNVTVAPTTVAPATSLPATVDTPKSATKSVRYDYVAIKKKSDDINSQFNKIVEDNKFSGAVYMKLGNDFEYLKTTGFADSEKHIDNSNNTRFYVGDATKQFTAAAVLLLNEQKKLSLDDTLDKYFPDYSAGAKITVKQLLTMTSGIKNYVCHNDITTPSNYLVSDINTAAKENNSPEENKKIIMNWVFAQDLIFAPGTKFESSESNYFLLGDIIEKASGVSYYQFLDKSILKPLGMGSTGFEPDKRIALPYDKQVVSQSLNYKGVGYSAFGLISSVSDLLKWTDGLLSNQVLSADSFNQMFTNQIEAIKDSKTAYGYGINLDGKTASASGRYDAYGSILTYNTDKSEIFIALTNSSVSECKLISNSFKKVLQKFVV